MADLVERLHGLMDSLIRASSSESIFVRNPARLMQGLSEAAKHITTLEAEAHEDARLLGMGGEREANMAGEIERLKRQVAALKAEASKGERRGLERALEFARFEAEAWGYEQGSSARVAAACIERAISALIPEAPAREGWQPIETAPKVDPLRSILIATRGYVGGVVQVSWSDTHQDFVDLDEDIYPDASHWRPLPPPPSQDREPDSQRGAK